MTSWQKLINDCSWSGSTVPKCHSGETRTNVEEKARRINISSTGRAINNGDKQGWVSNSQTRVTPQTPQAAQCIPQAEQAQAAQCKGGVLILRKWMTEKVGLVRCFSPGVKRNRRAKNSTVFMQCTLYSVQCMYCSAQTAEYSWGLLVLQALPWAHVTRHNASHVCSHHMHHLACITSHVSRKFFTNHIPHVTSWKLKSTIPRCHTCF